MTQAVNALPAIARQFDELQALPSESEVTNIQRLLRLPYSGVSNVASQGQTVSYDIFKWVVTVLLGAIGTVTWFYLSALIGEISSLRKDVVDTRIEMTKAIGAVEKQTSITNAKLEQFLEDMRRRR
jgi:hypothetical protein